MFEKYSHHGNDVFVRSDLKGKHRQYCLCFKCKRLNISNRDNNCRIANTLYAIDVAFNITTPVWECGEFEEIQVNES